MGAVSLSFILTFSLNTDFKYTQRYTHIEGLVRSPDWVLGKDLCDHLTRL